MTNPYQLYRETQVQTAPPETLVLMLYDGAIRFLQQARQQISAGEDPEAAITRAQDIIVELSNSLNYQAGSIAEHLFRLYDYYLFRLVQAYGPHNLEAVTEVVNHLRDLRMAWEQAVRQTRAGQALAESQTGLESGPPVAETR